MIVVVPFDSEDAVRAERLMDCCYWISGKKPVGHCLLVAGSDVHPEYRLKVRIAAEIAFESVDMMELNSVQGDTKPHKINSVFRQAARYVVDCYQHPFLWLEADNLPLKSNWLKALFREYDKQPRRYLGRFMQAKSGRFLSRTAIYPANAIHELDAHCQNAPPFERVANILPRCSSTRLIHMNQWNTDSVIPEDAVLINGDRSGLLVEALIESTAPKRKSKVAA